MVLGPKLMGKPTTWMRKTKFWTESRHYMVLGLKPMGKTNYLDEKKIEFCKVGYLITILRYSILGSNTVKGQCR